MIDWDGDSGEGVKKRMRESMRKRTRKTTKVSYCENNRRRN